MTTIDSGIDQAMTRWQVQGRSDVQPEQLGEGSVSDGLTGPHESIYIAEDYHQKRNHEDRFFHFQQKSKMAQYALQRPIVRIPVSQQHQRQNKTWSQQQSAGIGQTSRFPDHLYAGGRPKNLRPRVHRRLQSQQATLEKPGPDTDRESQILFN